MTKRLGAIGRPAVGEIFHTGSPLGPPDPAAYARLLGYEREAFALGYGAIT